MSGLRDFLYLDSAKVHSFISQIQGGLPSEISERKKQLGGWSGGLDVGPFKVDAPRGKESERQQTMQPNDPAYFDVIYQHLSDGKNDNQIIRFECHDLKEREKLNGGKFIEVSGVADPPVVENWIDRLMTLLRFTEKHAKTLGKTQSQGKGGQAAFYSGQQMKQLRELSDLVVDFIDLTRKDPNRQYIRVTVNTCNVWCSLIPAFVMVPLKSTLPANVRVLGRVDQLLKQGETWKIVDFSLFDQPINTMLNMFNSLNTMMGQRELTENDLQMHYPDVLVDPIAIYR
jgi:hypothetical protein